MWVSILLKYVLPVMVVLGVLTGAYFKGRHDANMKCAQREVKATVESINNATEAVTRGREWKEKVKVDLKRDPIDDLRDECLWNSKNSSEDCAEYLQD